ncbi:MAG: protein arginine kinase [Verrucomicrobiota bacterium]
MNFETLLDNPADWMQSRGPYSEIVLTSRVRLARNVGQTSFPGWASKSERKRILGDILPAVNGLEEMSDAFSEELENLSSIKKQVLVERHLISREHAARSGGSAAVMNANQSVSIMINEEDHLRMQSIEPGLNLEEAYGAIDSVDSRLEEALDYAFDSQLGYLTACPTNLGTGMRASVMLHLPALVLTEQVNKVVQAVNKIGLAVRGLYGEGTEALGNLFQVSNQNTLGEKEDEIIARLERVVGQIINNEQNARQMLLEDKPNTLFDQIGRAYAILRHSYIITSKEALNLLSVLRLAVDLECLPSEARESVDILLMQIQPAHLQIRAKTKLSAEKRDSLRAEIMRDQLKTLPEPDIFSLKRKGEASDNDDQ